MAVDIQTTNGVIETATGDLLRAGGQTWTAGAGESVRTDVPFPFAVRGDSSNAQFHRWNGSAWNLVDQPAITPGLTVLVDGATVALASSAGPVFSLTAAGDRTIDASDAGGASRVIVIQVKSDSSLSQRTIIFGTNFKATGALTTPLLSTKWVTATFHSDGANWIEDGRQTAGA